MHDQRNISSRHEEPSARTGELHSSGISFYMYLQNLTIPIFKFFKSGRHFSRPTSLLVLTACTSYRYDLRWFARVRTKEGRPQGNHACIHITARHIPSIKQHFIAIILTSLNNPQVDVREVGLPPFLAFLILRSMLAVLSTGEAKYAKMNPKDAHHVQTVYARSTLKDETYRKTGTSIHTSQQHI